MEKKSLTRRDFVKIAGVAAGASLLAACQATATPETITVEKTVVVTQEVEVPVEVETTVEVEKVVTATPLPTEPPEPVVMDVWWNTNIPDLAALAGWAPDAENEYFKTMWYWGGLGYTKFQPFVEAHPGVTLNITSHSWDWDLRQNQLMALAAGLIPDTTYGEAYVNEFVQLGVYSPLSQDVANLFAEGSYAGSLVDGKVYGLPKSSGADVLFINLTKYDEAGLDRTKLPTTWEELVTACQAIQKINTNDKWGNTCYYTYGPGGDSYGQAMRILHWFNQAGAPIGDNVGVPNINDPKAVDVWLFHNQLMWTSTEQLILQSESEGGSGKLFNDGVIAIKPGWNNDATSVGEGNIDATAIPFPIPPGGKPATIVIGNDMESAFIDGKYPDLAISLVEESTTNEEAQAFLADNAGIWIPALKSQLEQYETYDRLGGYKTDIAKNMVRVTMQQLLEGGSGPLPGWPKNGSRIWSAWNTTYGNIWQKNLGAEEIKAELDALQTTVEGLVAKSG
jgi:ABC-type glycerol-3-phosphate transport system substrate-binding protein